MHRKIINPLTPSVAIWVITAIKHPIWHIHMATLSVKGLKKTKSDFFLSQLNSVNLDL